MGIWHIYTWHYGMRKMNYLSKKILLRGCKVKRLSEFVRARVRLNQYEQTCTK